MIKNIFKRRELAQIVYESYTANLFELSTDEKKEHQHEVGAILKGYEKAIKEINQMIMDNLTINEIQSFINKQINGNK